MNLRQILDRVFLFLLSFFVMLQLMKGTGIIITAYLTVALSAVGYWLLNVKKTGETVRFYRRTACAFQFFALLTAVVCPPVITVLPCAAYDMYRGRNRWGLGLTILVIWNGFLRGLSVYGVLAVQLLMVLGVYLSFGTEKSEELYRNYHRIWDDSTEKRDRLKRQNEELQRARDAEIYTAQLSERNRIAREIHDNVGHILSRALLQVGALLSIHKEEPIHGQLTGLRETLDTAMTNIRSSVHDLHDDSIDVEESIRSMTEPLKNCFQVRLEMDFDGSAMPRPVKYAVLGITKEAVSNIMKHSRGDRVDIRLVEHPAMYQLVVHDYGEGEKSSVQEKPDDMGMGLENMQVRAESLGGHVHISREQGFRILAVIPVEKGRAAEEEKE